LALAHVDAVHGKLAVDKQQAIKDTMAQIVDDLDDHADVTAEPKEGEPLVPAPRVFTRGELRADWKIDYPVTCIACRSPLDEAAATMLAQLLEKHGLNVKVHAFADVASAKALRIEATDAPLVCLSYFGATGNPAHVRFLIRRLKRIMPTTKFLACYWMLGSDREKSEDWKTAVGAHFVASALADAVAICVREGMVRSEDTCSRSQAPSLSHTASN
jgi:hypothetical protein